MTAFIASFIFILLAETGDKTQLLAIAFAAKYKAYKVLAAVFIATAVNHALAVAAGRFLTTVIPLDAISLAASVSFVIFGLWTIRGDSLDGEDKRPSRFGPVVTVAIAFFLAEMGDKTQLATISLAVQYRNVFGVLMGTTLAMVTADAIGIAIGVVMHRHLPQAVIKWLSAAIFVLFGLGGMRRALSAWINPPGVWAILALTTAIVILIARALLRAGTERPANAS